MGPDPILPTVAQDMYKLYNDTFNVGENNTTTVSFDLQKMRDMLDDFETAGADIVKVYFGAIENDGVAAGVSPFIQTTVFFQAAIADPEDPSSTFNDIPFENVSPFDLGNSCPLPKCKGLSNY